MKKSMICASLLALSFAQAPAAAQSAEMAEAAQPATPGYTVPVGSPAIDAAVIAPYHAVWSTGAGFFEERLTAADDTRWRHVQRAYAPLSRETADVVEVDDAYLATSETRLIMRDTLASAYMHREVLRELPDPAAHKEIEVAADDEGYAGLVTTAGGDHLSWQLRTGRASFDGWIAGLAIAALPLEEGYTATLPTVTHLFRGSHSITITVVGRGAVTVGTGETIECWEVEAEWLDLASGDIYQPGRDGNGGTYYIAVQPGAGVPFVVEYASAGSSIMWDGIRRN